MDINAFIQGVLLVLSWNILLALIVGVILGLIFGATPGFTDIMGMIVVLPLTYSLSPMTAVALIIGIYVAGDFAGSIPGILIGVPGTTQSMVTIIDGHALAKKGMASEAVGNALSASCLGSIISYVFLFLLLQIMVTVALKFGPPEMFLVAILGLTIIAFVHPANTYRALLAGFFGILLGTIGMTPAGAMVGTMGFPELMEGIPLVPALIGLVGMSELFEMVASKQEYVSEVGREKSKTSFRKILIGAKRVLHYKASLLRSSLIGVWIGLIPGAGATISSIISYNEGRRATKDPEYGKGSFEGVTCVEGANNATMGGAMATTLALGIPGSMGCAILIGALILHGFNPGPRLFLENMPMVYGIMFSQFVAVIFLAVIGLLFCTFAAKFSTVPMKQLIPVVAVLIMVGTFAVRKSMFDVHLTLILGILGWIFKKYDYPTMAVVLGIILGPIANIELIRTVELFGGDLSPIFHRPVCLILMGAVIISLFYPILRKMIWKES